MGVAKRFRDVGVVAGTIEANTPIREREDLLDRFKRGSLRVLTNVNTLTEGVDVPEARTVILARAFGHVGGFLQAAGRALRPADGKADAILIDLPGSTIRHGLPTDDRAYSLEGRAISGGAERPHGEWAVPDFSQTVRGVALRCVATGANSGVSVPLETVMIDNSSVHRRALDGFVASCKEQGLRQSLAIIRFKSQFGYEPPKEWIRQ